MSDYAMTLITMHLLTVLYIAYKISRLKNKGEKND